MISDEESREMEEPLLRGGIKNAATTIVPNIHRWVGMGRSNTELLGNIAQFIDFSRKLLSTSRAISNSSSGFSHSCEDVYELTKNLKAISAKLKPLDIQSPTSQTSASSLESLALQCDTTATALLAVLQKLVVKGKSSKWESFRVALKTMWKMENIDEVNKVLDSYRLQLILELQSLER